MSRSIISREGVTHIGKTQQECKGKIRLHHPHPSEPGVGVHLGDGVEVGRHRRIAQAVRGLGVGVEVYVVEGAGRWCGPAGVGDRAIPYHGRFRRLGSAPPEEANLTCGPGGVDANGRAMLTPGERAGTVVVPPAIACVPPRLAPIVRRIQHHRLDRSRVGDARVEQQGSGAGDRWGGEAGATGDGPPALERRCRDVPDR